MNSFVNHLNTEIIYHLPPTSPEQTGTINTITINPQYGQ